MGIDNVDDLKGDGTDGSQSGAEAGSVERSTQDGLTDSAPALAKEWDRDTQAPVEDDEEQQKRRAAREDSERQLEEHRRQAVANGENLGGTPVESDSTSE